MFVDDVNHMHTFVNTRINRRYGVATISRLLKIGLFCKRALQTRLYSGKGTYNFKEPTNRSHPITHMMMIQIKMHVLVLLSSMFVDDVNFVRIFVQRCK